MTFGGSKMRFPSTFFACCFLILAGLNHNILSNCSPSTSIVLSWTFDVSRTKGTNQPCWRQQTGLAISPLVRISPSAIIGLFAALSRNEGQPIANHPALSWPWAKNLTWTDSDPRSIRTSIFKFTHSYNCSHISCNDGYRSNSFLMCWIIKITLSAWPWAMSIVMYRASDLLANEEYTHNHLTPMREIRAITLAHALNKGRSCLIKQVHNDIHLYWYSATFHQNRLHISWHNR